MTVNTLFISRQSITFFMSKRALTLCLSLFLMLILSACQTTPTAPKVTDKSAQTPITSSKPVPALPKANSGKGAYYLDDGPGDNPPLILRRAINRMSYLAKPTRPLQMNALLPSAAWAVGTAKNSTGNAPHRASYMTCTK